MDAELWDDEYRSSPEYAEVPDRTLSQEVEHLPPGKALDLGCGAGTNALMLAKRGWSVHGVDWSSEAIAQASATAERLGLHATFEVGDITHWQPQEHYDLVICTFALPSPQDALSILRSASDALTSNGTLVVVEWDRSMAEVWQFAPEELLTASEIADLLPELHIEKADTIHVADMFADSADPRAFAGPSATIALLRAKRATE